MTRLRLLLVLAMVLATVGVAPPARAGLLDSLLGGSSGEPTGAGNEGTSTGACRPLTVPVVEVGVGSCSGVFPGAQVQAGSGSCTLNFLFKGSDGGRYMGTAGHCVLSDLPISGDVGTRVFAAGEGPAALDADGDRIGTFAYAVQQQPRDFGLIRLDDDVDATPVVAQFGGPTGVNDEITTEVTTLSLFGNPLGIGGPLAIGRPLLALDGLSDPNTVAATGLALPGDSGGPVLDEQGRAVGVLTAIGLGAEADGLGLLVITRLSPQLEQAERALGIDLTLQTAPRL